MPPSPSCEYVTQAQALSASAAGTAAFFARSATTCSSARTSTLFSRMPRTGLTLSRLAFGGDNVGSSTGRRSQALLAALKSRTCNAVVLNLNELSDRRVPTSPMYARDDVSQLWEVGATRS